LYIEILNHHRHKIFMSIIKVFNIILSDVKYTITILKSIITIIIIIIIKIFHHKLLANSRDIFR
jgi:hypothetical protein